MFFGMFGRLAKAMLLGAVFLAAAEAALVGVVEGVEAVRRKFFWGQPPEEGFPWREQPEIEVESSGERVKLYPDYGRLYEDMLEEIGRAEEYIFVETFIWQASDVGRRFVEALESKAREGVKVYAVFDALANLGQPESFKEFPEGINTLRFRSFSGPLSALNPRNLHRTHRRILSIDGRVAFIGGVNIGEIYTRWRGTHMRIRGEEVHEIERAFVGFWNTHRTGELPEIPPHDPFSFKRSLPPRLPGPGYIPHEPRPGHGAGLHNERLLHARCCAEGEHDRCRWSRGGRAGSHPDVLKPCHRGLARPPALR